jgi:MFS family permease
VSTAPVSAPPSPGKNEKILFWASFFTLVAAGIGFSVRGVILEDWGNQFGFTQAELGTITGGGLVGFGLAIIFFSFFADRFGYGKLMCVAFLLHASSAVVTFAATPVYGGALSSLGISGKSGAFYCLNLGMWLFALGNGTCEAVINPLTATLFPRSKTHWLNILHAGWPGGLILGVGITLGFEQLGGAIRWEYKLGVFLIPVLIYGLLMLGRPFPKSEAKTAGVPVTDMMKQVGMLGFTLGAALIGLALASLLPSVFGAPAWIGWIAAGCVWLAFGLVTNFAPGHWVLAFLYLLHALVGYVELGTDSWITNITKQVLKSGTNAQLAFIWTNVLMFTLRFFAGPIVHKINPIGLLFASASLGTIGLYLLGNPMIDTVWRWMAAVTVYGIGKTFYWPTLLGVISERFPKGGALALGLSGGVGMIGAGILGGPGIGYKQDYFAVHYLEQTTEGQETYKRYMARNEKGEPEKTSFPIVTSILPNQVPPVAGIDNAKFKVFEDYKAGFAADGKRKPDAKTTLESDLETLARQEKEGKTVEPKLKENLTKLKHWWDTEGLPYYSNDQQLLTEARLYGAKNALLYTAVVPLVLAIGFMILILYFYLTGGYKQVHLDEEERPMGEY